MADDTQTHHSGMIPELIQATLDSLPAHIAVLGEAGEILAVNTAWRHFADDNGYNGPSYGLGTNYLQVCEAAVGQGTDIARAAVQGLREVLMAQREQFLLEYPCHGPVKRRWFVMRASRFTGGGPIRVLVTHEDISERKLAEEALSESQSHLNEAQRLTHIGSWTWNLETNEAAWSDELYRIFGLAPQEREVTYETYLSLLHIDDRVMVEQIIAKAAHRQQSFAYDCRIVSADGTIRNTHTRGSSVLVDGAIRHMLGTVQDTTERTHAEAALRHQAERLQALRAIDEAILAAQSSEEIALVVLRAVHNLIPYQRGSLSVFDFDSQELVFVAVLDELEPLMKTGFRYSFADICVADTVITRLQAGEAFLLDLRTLAPRPPLVDHVLIEGLRYFYCLPLTARGDLIGSLQIAIHDPGALADEQTSFFHEMAAPAAVAILQARLFEQVRIGHERLQELSRRLVDVQEIERRQIAQELHDQVGQNLSALSLNLSVLHNQLPEDMWPSMADRLEESLRFVDDMVERIRDVMSSLRPSILDDYGLAAALRWYVRSFAQRTALDVTTQITREDSLPRLPATTETALFRIAQEALTNVAKHARATEVTVLLKNCDGLTRLSITDNGEGFDLDESYMPGQRRNLGLIGMRERIETVGGRLRIESAPGHGTRIVAEVPR